MSTKNLFQATANQMRTAKEKINFVWTILVLVSYMIYLYWIDSESKTKSTKWLIKFYILFILAKQYSCQPRICSLASDARSVRGNKDSVAWACSMDSNCKAFRHSSKHGIGFLCNPSDNQTDDGYEDWELCSFNW